MSDPRIAVYPGSFDPLTNGHLDVLRRAAVAFDEVVVAVLANPRKEPLLDATTRVDVVRASLAAGSRAGATGDAIGAAGGRGVVGGTGERPAAGLIEVATFEGLTVDFCRARGARFIVRGLRAISDFEAEIQLAHNNRVLAPDVDTVFFMTSLEHGYVSSSLVKEIALFGGDVSGMIPAPALEALNAALARHG